MALMGIPAAQAVLPRGPIEAAGVGLKLAPGDVALRCNFATVQGPVGRFSLLDRRAGRIDVQTDELAEALSTHGCAPLREEQKAALWLLTLEFAQRSQLLPTEGVHTRYSIL